MRLAFYIHDTRVIHEVIDGEAIMINLDNGNYYTMNDTGAFVWQLIAQECSFANIVIRVAEQFAMPTQQCETPVKDFINHLLREGLILRRDITAEPENLVMPEIKMVYAPPELTVFDDMQELLLLDPIHEVSEEGWPHVSQDQDKVLN